MTNVVFTEQETVDNVMKFTFWKRKSTDNHRNNIIVMLLKQNFNNVNLRN